MGGYRLTPTGDPQLTACSHACLFSPTRMRARGAGSWDLDLRIVEFDNVAQLLTAHQRAICSYSFGGGHEYDVSVSSL